MLTFNSDPVKKQARIDRAKHHIAQDRLVVGCYREGKTNRGCSVGCDAIDICNNTDDNPHKIVADHDCVPEWLEHLRDAIFEGLPETERSQWHLQLAEAIPVGVDIEIVRHQLADWILSSDGPIPQEGPENSTVAPAIAQVREYHQNCVNGFFETESAARSAAESAAESAWSAAESAARSAARSAVWSARSAAWSAWSAWSAAESAAASAAWSAAWSAAQSAAWSAESAAESAAQSAAWSAWSAAESAARSAESAAESAESAARSAAFETIAAKVISLLQAAE